MDQQQNSDLFFMQLAISEAKKALDKREVPIGAVVVCRGKVVGRGHNLVETLADATAHAEMHAITAAASTLGGKYLKECTLYVTVEPCVMCAGALAWSQIGRVVYGAADPKRGCMRFGRDLLHPKTELLGGVMAEECSALMEDFF
ncbi:MAG: nucleoside deaminase, partial [Rikenellaceae bacterium]|nr:nucleoside deaminase [Rikenellaceae bacterium]